MPSDEDVKDAEEVGNLNRPLSFDALPGEATNLAELDERRGASSTRSADTLTIDQVLKEINTPGGGAAIQAQRWYENDLSKKRVIELVTKAVLYRRRPDEKGWQRYAPVIREALTLRDHPLDCECRGCT
jgi:hypothetical protein